MNSNLEVNRQNPGLEIQRKTMTDRTKKGRLISTQTVSDDLDELYLRKKKELELIETLKDRLKLIRDDEGRRLREIDELKEKQVIELKRRKRRIMEEEMAKEKKRIEIKRQKAKNDKKVKEIEKLKETERVAEELRMAAKAKVEKRKCQEENEKWQKDFGFKKPAPKIARKSLKKPIVSSSLREVIIISDDDFSQQVNQRTPILERMKKTVKVPIVVPSRVVHSKDLNFYRRDVVDSSFETEEDDSDDSDEYVEIPRKTNFEISPIGMFPVDMDNSKCSENE